MSILAATQRKLLNTAAMISRAERELVQSPEKRSVLRAIESLEKMRRQLELEFAEQANAFGYDVCSYRLFSESRMPGIAAIGSALSAFQSLLTVVFDALRNGPRSSVRASATIAKVTELQFGYTYSGSAGFVLVLPNERMLQGVASELDDTVAIVFSMASAVDPLDLSRASSRLGLGPIHALRQWSEVHHSVGLGADITWKGPSDYPRQLVLQRSELQRLAEFIDATESPTVERLTVVGELTMVNTASRGFRLTTKNGIVIHGHYDESAIDEAHTVELPHQYRAQVLKTVATNPVTGEEHVSYLLEKLRPA